MLELSAMHLYERHAVRGLLLSPANELLLIHTRTSGGEIWLVPGGGIEDQEDLRTALARELREELDFELTQDTVEVWQRSFTYVSSVNGPSRQNERYFLIRTEKFEPSFEHVPEEDERLAMLEGRWWTVDQIAAASHQHRFSPPSLATWLKQLINEVPKQPITLGMVDHPESPSE